MKVGLLLTLVAGITVAFLIYVLFTHGVFEQSGTVVLVSSDAEGINVGMPVTFSGFPVAKVSRIRLSENGEAHIEIRVPEKNGRWLREGSLFILEKPLVGAAKIKVFTGNFENPKLQEGSKQNLIIGDASAEIPDLIERVKRILVQIDTLVDKDSSFNQILLKIETLFGKMTGEYGILEGILGSRERARQVTASLEQLDSIFKSIEEMSGKGNLLLEKADTQVFGKEGILALADRSMGDIRDLLLDLRGILKKTEAVLDDAKGITSDFKKSTTDIDQLRTEIENNMRQIEHLIDDVKKYFPLSESPEIRLP
ncbi:MAG: MlaD family protein [Thermodesulfobacteriota bacterium]